MEKINSDQNKKLISKDIWIFSYYRDGELDRETLGLIAEAKRLIADNKEGEVSIVALGAEPLPDIKSLGKFGVDRLLYVADQSFNHYKGELFAETLFRVVNKYKPFCILMAQSTETSDLSARLAALMETTLITHAMDFTIDKDGKGLVIRPVSNGYLFEQLGFEMENCPIICFESSVLSDPETGHFPGTDIVQAEIDTSYNPKTKLIEIIEADPEGLDLEEADLIVASGRGMGKGDAFKIIHELANVLGGTVGGSRPVIDWQLLPFERQIGQTGKNVTPKLIFACGISGANEFTAGMEKSLLVVAVNTDPNARIFRFADIGVIGDVHEVIPRLVERIKEFRTSNINDEKRDSF